MRFLNWLKSFFVKSAPQIAASTKYQWQDEWTKYIRNFFYFLPDVLEASDFNQLHRNFNILTREEKADLLAAFIKELCLYESGFNPLSESVDVGKASDKNTWSVGLMQVSASDQENLGINLGYTYEDLKNPIKNLHLGLTILVNQIKKRGKIFIPKGEKGNPGVYWAVIHPGGKYDKTNLILAKTRAMQLDIAGRSNPEPQNEVHVPWYGIAQKEKGVAEISGGKHNPRIIEYGKATTLEPSDDETPWCAIFVCWCLEKVGYKSTNSAWARDYLNYGIKLAKPQEGCIVVFSRGANSGHVGFFVSETEDHVLVLGGNQDNKVCTQFYPKSRVLGYRWPIK